MWTWRTTTKTRAWKERFYNPALCRRGLWYPAGCLWFRSNIHACTSSNTSLNIPFESLQIGLISSCYCSHSSWKLFSNSAWETNRSCLRFLHFPLRASSWLWENYKQKTCRAKTKKQGLFFQSWSYTLWVISSFFFLQNANTNENVCPVNFFFPL